MSFQKLFNDPVHGFITVRSALALQLIDHAYIQRLRRISQLGLVNLVYPGALHTRFHHTIGAMHLMSVALETIKSKGFEVTKDEYENAITAILLHDVGHGPFSHNLENAIFQDVSHEVISKYFIKKLNTEFGGALLGACDIFNNNTEKHFLHQLVSGQLDVDRLDYLNRDSFFTGVSEGHINTERILKMITLSGNGLVVELKGIYSIEKFIVARRLMYWQVYFHKTVLAAQIMLTNILKRVRFLTQNGTNLPMSENLRHFMENNIDEACLEKSDEHLTRFSQLDDIDIYSSMKLWADSSDVILSDLSYGILNRRLFKAELQVNLLSEEKIKDIEKEILKNRNISKEDISYYAGFEYISNTAYSPEEESIKFIDKQGNVLDISYYSDILNIEPYRQKVKKQYFYYPKWAMK